MRQVTPTVWTAQRKWLGNLIPALFWFPLAAIGIYQIVKREQFIGIGLWFLIASTVVGWLALNQFGFFQNIRMRRQLERILRVQNEEVTGQHMFVGFATPKYSSMIDAHEDVGFLRLLPDRLQFVSEVRRLDLMKADIGEIRFRWNVHSLVGLGRWVGVDAKVDEKPIRLLVEPRQRRTMLGSRRDGVKLLKMLRDWKSGSPPPSGS